MTTTNPSDEELLRIVQSEQSAAIGFDLESDLTKQRDVGLKAFNGLLPDMDTKLQNRSKFVSSDVADGIRTIIPSIIEIFTGEDCIAFAPVGEEDEEQAQQETEWVKHVVFNQNNGWLLCYTAIMDALQAKTGIFQWWWEENQAKPEEKRGKNQMEVELAAKDGDITDLRPSDEQVEGEEPGMPLFDFTVTPRNPGGKTCIDNVAPEDIAVARDTVLLKDATYCALRSRPRVQELLAMGIEPDLLDKLPEYMPVGDDVEMVSRDPIQSDEYTTGQTTRAMRQVMIYTHYVRFMSEDETVIWRVLTGGEGEMGILLKREKVDGIQVSAGAPFIVTHKFFGQSLADVLIDVQRVKTALMRMLLDSGYFAINQRHIIDINRAGAQAVQDYLRNEPGVPMRVDNMDSVAPLGSAGLSFDPLPVLEYFSTQGEQRSGIMRNAQGLNPDTLHDTAKGMMALLTEAQTRTRMIARSLAETLFKYLYLGVHDMERQYNTTKPKARLLNKWVEVSPSSWDARSDVRVEVGVGASGRDHDIMVCQMLGDVQEKLVEAQGGPNGPMMDPEHIYALCVRLSKKLGVKDPEQFFPDPKAYQPPPQASPPPDPALIKVQQDGQIAQAQLQLETQKTQGQQELDQAKAIGEHQYKQNDLELRAQQIAQEDQYRRDQAEAELQLRREQLAAELAEKQRQFDLNYELEQQRMAMDVHKHQAVLDNKTEIASSVRVGGEPG